MNTHSLNNKLENMPGLSEGPGPPEEEQLKNAELDDRNTDVLHIHEESNDQAQNYTDYGPCEPEKTNGYEMEIEQKPPTYAELLRGNDSNTSSLIQSDDLQPQAIQHQDNLRNYTRSLSESSTKMYEDIKRKYRPTKNFDQRHMLKNASRKKLISLCSDHKTEFLLCDENSSKSHKSLVLSLILGCAKPQAKERVLDLIQYGYFLKKGCKIEQRRQTFYLSDHKKLWLEIRTKPNFKPDLVLKFSSEIGDIQVGKFQVETSPGNFKSRVVFNEFGEAVHYNRFN